MEATCIFINKWMDKEDEVDIYLEYYLTIKNEIMPFAATWMDLEIIIVSEVSQSEKDKFHMTYHLFVESLKNEPISKTEIKWQR